MEVIVPVGNAFRLVMVLIAIKRPGICHYFYLYSVLLTMAKETFPVDTGQLWRTYQNLEFISWFAAYALGNLRDEIAITTVQQIYTSFFVRYYVYG